MSINEGIFHNEDFDRFYGSLSVVGPAPTNFGGLPITFSTLFTRVSEFCPKLRVDFSM
jgi:hypothetical protein